MGNTLTNKIFKSQKETIKTFDFFYKLEGNTLGKRISNFYNVVTKNNINNPLLYFNTNWQYGIKDKESYNYFYGNRNNFKKYIKKFDNEILQTSEIICHIPLSKDDFYHVFEHMGGNNQNVKIRSQRRRKTK